MSANPFDPGELFGHVKDADYFHVPRFMGEHLALPQPLLLEQPIVAAKGSLEAFDLRFTKFMVLEVVAAILIAALSIGLARRIAAGGAPRGRFWNLIEALVAYIRDQVARPAIGHHDAEKFLPFLWTMFFFVLVNNLLGLIPWLGSATAALATTGALAVITFATVTGAGMAKMGFVGFWKSQVPHMDLHGVLAFFLVLMIFLIEVLGLLIKHFVLAVRLLANMMAGHLVLAVIVAFVSASASSLARYGVAPASVLGAVALSLLELFVAFLQAYIFTFLSALFIGMAVHPH